MIILTGYQISFASCKNGRIAKIDQNLLPLKVDFGKHGYMIMKVYEILALAKLTIILTHTCTCTCTVFVNKCHHTVITCILSV